MQIFIYRKVTLHVSSVTAPIIRSTKNCNRSLQRGPIGPRWREVAVPVFWPVPEAAVTEEKHQDSQKVRDFLNVIFCKMFLRRALRYIYFYLHFLCFRLQYYIKILQWGRSRFENISGEAAGIVNYACPQGKMQWKIQGLY